MNRPPPTPQMKKSGDAGERPDSFGTAVSGLYSTPVAQVLGQPTPTMSSREIALLTEKQHQHVKRDVEKMLTELGEDVSKFGRIYIDGMNREQTEYALDRELTDVLLTGYSAVLRRKVIARWRELETAVAPAVPTSLSGALRLAAEQAELIERQQAELASAAPAVKFVDRYVDSTGLKGFRQVCKLIGANESNFRTFLTKREIMYRLGGEWMPYAQHIKAGRFVVKAGTADSSSHAFNSAKFTPRGVQWVAGEYAKYLLTANQAAE
ncbi:phage antirepressor KilAC domain-containing protein [Pseudoduganella violacea]|uniref:Phage antirepressor YoqD-like protein n=1 Tax=Pseudoduganella violacea TaxID=1715466 RepID=A0A7W5B893_9BURK|nr:phage antirepressor KilAC domain-containing protein [Pseudoduganella violacea]MBB3118364.1 phage antirepressor YoqD-like protein [Pseudoduganella violacea]